MAVLSSWVAALPLSTPDRLVSHRDSTITAIH
jgi:hypothetical protein